MKPTFSLQESSSDTFNMIFKYCPLASSLLCYRLKHKYLKMNKYVQKFLQKFTSTSNSWMKLDVPENEFEDQRRFTRMNEKRICWYQHFFFSSIPWWRCKRILVLKSYLFMIPSLCTVIYVKMSSKLSCNVFKSRKLDAIII